MVKVLGIEGNRIKLSRKALLKEQREKLGLPEPITWRFRRRCAGSACAASASSGAGTVRKAAGIERQHHHHRGWGRVR